MIETPGTIQVDVLGEYPPLAEFGQRLVVYDFVMEESGESVELASPPMLTDDGGVDLEEMVALASPPATVPTVETALQSESESPLGQHPLPSTQ